MLVFVEPSNVLGIKKLYDSDGKYACTIIKLKYPYDKHTHYEGYWDYENAKNIIYYYYMYIDDQNIYQNGKKGAKGEIIVR